MQSYSPAPVKQTVISIIARNLAQTEILVLTNILQN